MVLRLSPRGGLGEDMPRLLHKPGREDLDRLILALQLESEVVELPADHERRVLAPRVIDDLITAPDGVLADELHRDLRPFDRGTRNPVAISKVTEITGARPPAPAYTRLRDARPGSVGSLFVDDEIERHELREQLGESAVDAIPRRRHARREFHSESTIDACHGERGVFDGLHEHAAFFSPALDAFIEEVARKSVHFPDVTTATVRLHVEVVGREVIAAGNHQLAEVSIVARHPVKRFDRAHHREIWNELVVGIHQQLRPGSIDRHRLDRLAISGQPAVLDYSAALEKVDCLPIGDPVERHGKIELVRCDAEVRARQSDALGISRELKLRLRRRERAELDVAIRQNKNPSARNTAMNTSGHLQNLVRAEVQAREDVLPFFDEIAEARVVDDHRVETVHVQRALAGGGHREEVRLFCAALQKGTDHSDRLTAVIESAVDSREAFCHELRRLLDAGPCRQEHPDPPTLLRHLLKKAIVEKFKWLLAHHFHVSGPIRIECGGLENLGRIEISSVERRIHRRGKPDETTADALAERKAELELRRCLMDLVNEKGVGRQDVAVMEPPSRDPGGDDDDAPRRSFRRRLTLTIHHADAKRVGVQYSLGDGANRQCLPGAGAGDYPESQTAGGEIPDMSAVLLLEHSFYVKAERQLDCLACSARGRNDDYPPGRRLSGEKRLMIRRQIPVGYASHHVRGKVHRKYRTGNGPGCEAPGAAIRARYSSILVVPLPFAAASSCTASTSS